MSESPTQVVYQDQQPVLVLRAAELRALSGPDAGAVCSLELHRVGVGTATDNQLVLSDPLVSRHHLELQVQDRGYLVRDLGSTNGTFYRGARIQEAVLGVGAEVRLGSTVLRVEKGAERSQLIGPRGSFGALLGSSPAMQELYGLLATVATTDSTVLIEGETGTGKELVAVELHRQSPRREGPLCVVDCGALPPGLVESELFGHERGAFTGADSSREGVFERARGGTVFLDEIGELALEMQTRLLRVLDERVVKRVGGDLPRKVDVRLVAATNRELAAEVKAKRFRADLYYRLAVVCVVLPPLRKRREDIPLLARHFLWQAGCADPSSVLAPGVLEVLRSRAWPGNVRELRNVIERAVLLTDGSKSASALFEEQPPEQPAPPPARRPAARRPAGWLAQAMPPEMLEQPYKEAKRALVQEFESLYLGRLHRRHGTNISRIAQEAGIDRQLVRRLLRKHDLGGE